MKQVLSSIVLLLVLIAKLNAQTAPDTTELTNLLKEFLVGASHNDASIHDRFWAEDLIYTRSSGLRVGKADIMRNVRSVSASTPEAPTNYSAEDIRIQQYDNTAVVAFRLVGATEKDGTTRIAKFWNTGTFVKRNGKWQAVAWQATVMPRSDADARKEVAAVDSTFHAALLTANTKVLESLADDAFVWTHDAGEQATRKQMLEALSSGQLKYSKLETSNVTVSVSGDTAIVRGASTRQRAAFPGSSTGDAAPFTAFYTLTLVNKGGEWKALAMHTSRP